MAQGIQGTQPAIEFEEAHNVSGIAGRYQFPPGEMDRLALQRRIWPAYGVQLLPHGELEQVFTELQRLNPEQIGKIQFNRSMTNQLRDVVHGIVSGFNPDDINFFLKRTHGNMPLAVFDQTAPGLECAALRARIGQRLEAGGFGWVASQPTLERIWEQVKGRRIAQPHFTEAFHAGHPGIGPGWAVGLGVAAIAGYGIWQVMMNREKPALAKAAGNSYASNYLHEKEGGSVPER